MLRRCMYNIADEQLNRIDRRSVERPEPQTKDRILNGDAPGGTLGPGSGRI